jgi:hypothetical protein
MHSGFVAAQRALTARDIRLIYPRGARQQDARAPSRCEQSNRRRSMLKIVIGLSIAAAIAAVSATSASAQAGPKDRSTVTKSYTETEPSYFRQAAGADQM